MNEWDKCNSSPAAYKTISHKPHAECGSHLELPNEDNSTDTVFEKLIYAGYDSPTSVRKLQKINKNVIKIRNKQCLSDLKDNRKYSQRK